MKSCLFMVLLTVPPQVKKFATLWSETQRQTSREGDCVVSTNRLLGRFSFDHKSQQQTKQHSHQWLLLSLYEDQADEVSGAEMFSIYRNIMKKIQSFAPSDNSLPDRYNSREILLWM